MEHPHKKMDKPQIFGFPVFTEKQLSIIIQLTEGGIL